MRTCLHNTGFEWMRHEATAADRSYILARRV
jgi:hypothetical protein